MDHTAPDELYTLRAQFWLGHYTLAVEEAKSVARRPMSPNLKVERDVFLARAYGALGQADKVMAAAAADSANGPPALAALADKVQFDAAAGNEAAQQAIVDHIKTLVGSHSQDPLLLLIASQVLLSAGQTKEALQCVSSSHAASTHLELMITALQVYLKLDRLDLARQQLQAMKQLDEDGILTQLASVYVFLASGATGAADAVHVLNALSEQYGCSVYLLNLTACALMQQGDYAGAEQKLDECLREHQQSSPEVPPLPDTLINAICCTVQQGKSPATYLQQLQQLFPRHAYCAGWERVVAAFDREAVKYKV